MQYNPGDGTGIVDEVNDICGSDDNNYPLTSKARRSNDALDRFTLLAFKSDGRFTFDDSNYTTRPLFTQNLVSGTQSYLLSSFVDSASAGYELLKMLRFEILTANGDTKKLNRLNVAELEVPLTTYKNVAGTPDEYNLIGNFLDLYAKPNYNSTGGLKAFADRISSRFTSADTSKEPGIPSVFHMYIARMTALPFLIEKSKPNKNDVAIQIQRDEQEIMDFFNDREKGIRKSINMRYESNE